MNNADYQPFAAALSRIVQNYQKLRPNSEQTDFWFEVLKRFELREILQAFTAYASDPDVEFAPKTNNIIKLIEGSSGERATVAWTKVVKAIGSAGTYTSVAFDDPLVHVVLRDMGGWPAICRSEEAKLPFVERDFVARYRSFVSRGEMPEHPKYLVGLSESDCRQKGLLEHIPAPVLIGDPDRAQLVYERGATGEAKQLSLAKVAERIVQQANRGK